MNDEEIALALRDWPPLISFQEWKSDRENWEAIDADPLGSLPPEHELAAIPTAGQGAACLRMIAEITNCFATGSALRKSVSPPYERDGEWWAPCAASDSSADTAPETSSSIIAIYKECWLRDHGKLGVRQGRYRTKFYEGPRQPGRANRRRTYGAETMSAKRNLARFGD